MDSSSVVVRLKRSSFGPGQTGTRTSMMFVRASPSDCSWEKPQEPAAHSKSERRQANET